jgi:4-azaleucine resistance transporter AzlC
MTTFPVFVGYVSVGFAFGLLFQQTGLPFGWAIAMSLFVYAGSMQFVAISLLMTNASFIDIGLMTLFVNFRHLFYGLSLLDPFSRLKNKKPYGIFALTDETYSILVSAKTPPTMSPSDFIFRVSLMNQLYWILGTCLGGLFGQILPLELKGIDFIMTALFTVLLTEQWLSQKGHTPIYIGFGASSAVLFLLGPSNMVIPSSLLIITLLLIFRKSIESPRASSKEEHL